MGSIRHNIFAQLCADILYIKQIIPNSSTLTAFEILEFVSTNRKIINVNT